MRKCSTMKSTITGGARLTQIQIHIIFNWNFFSITQTKYFKTFDLQPSQSLIKDSLWYKCQINVLI